MTKAHYVMDASVLAAQARKRRAGVAIAAALQPMQSRSMRLAEILREHLTPAALAEASKLLKEGIDAGTLRSKLDA